MPVKDYAKIAQQRIQRPADIKRLPKIHIYARNKKGKTTFGLSAGVEKTLVLDPEHGTDQMKAKNPHVWPVNKWEDMDEAYNFLKLGDHEYEWVVVDGLTRLSQMALKYTMQLQEANSLDRIPGQVQQRDYGRAGEVVKTMLTEFSHLSYGVIFTSQERANETLDSEEDEDIESETMEFVPDLPRGVRGYVNSIVDVIGRLYVVKIDGPNDTRVTQRRLWVAESLKYDTGYRSDFVLPDHIKVPTIPKLVQLMEEGKVTRPARKKVAASS